jgi:hypothetical protein
VSADIVVLGDGERREPKSPGIRRDGGWVKIYRRLFDDRDTDCRDFFEQAVFAYFIAKAARQPVRVRYKGEQIHLQEGQLAVSSRDLSIRTGFSRQVIRRILDGLTSNQMITQDTTQGVTIVTVCKYREYQSSGEMGNPPTNHDVTQGQPTGNPPTTQPQPTEQRIKESKEGKERKNQQEIDSPFGLMADCSSPARSATADRAAPFEEWWAQVPKKVGKGSAERAFQTALKQADFQTLIAGIMRYAAERADQDPKFTRHPATWLRDKGWLDEPRSLDRSSRFGRPEGSRARSWEEVCENVVDKDVMAEIRSERMPAA